MSYRRRGWRIGLIVAVTACLLAAGDALAAPAPAPAPAPAAGGDVVLSPEAGEAVVSSQAWLAARQNEDGSFGAFGGKIPMTALAGLAFLSAGVEPGDDEGYGQNVRRAIEFLLRVQGPDSGLFRPRRAGGLGAHAPMYGQAFATLFLAEAYARTTDEKARDALHGPLRAAVGLIEAVQNREGGWRYAAVPRDADVSVTTCQLMALRAAQSAGVEVDPDVLALGVDYVRKCQNLDGGFSYMANQNSGSGLARTAAGTAVLQYLGSAVRNPEVAAGGAKPIPEAVEAGLKYLQLATRGPLDREGHFLYGSYYTTHAARTAGGEFWAEWYARVSAELLKRAKEDEKSGRVFWEGDAGSEYGTAMAVIILRAPEGKLLSFQKAPPPPKGE